MTGLRDAMIEKVITVITWLLDTDLKYNYVRQNNQTVI